MTPNSSPFVAGKHRKSAGKPMIELLSFDSPSPFIDLRSWDHSHTPLNNTMLKTPISSSVVVGIRKPDRNCPIFFHLFLSRLVSAWLATTTHSLNVARRSSRYNFCVVKWPEEGFGFGGRQRCGKRAFWTFLI